MKSFRMHHGPAFVLLLCLLAACASEAPSSPSVALPKSPVGTSEPANLAPVRQDFTAWLQDFQREARAKGIGQPVLDNAFANVTAPMPEIVTHDRTQPEKIQTFSQYMEGFVTSAKVGAARAQWDSHAEVLDRVQRQYGVPAPILLALWHTESRFGKHQGHYSIIQSLVTLAYDGRRSAFFRAQLVDALMILQRERMDSRDLNGSWAGAMGEVQFMPSSFLAYAVDFDGDGKKDIWTDDADALASMANYLHSKGWDERLGWGFPVAVPEGAQSAQWLRTKEKHTLAEWQSLGLRDAAGQSFADSPPTLMRLIMPDNDPRNAYLVNGNYDVIMDWNRSVYFATGVCQLADAIAAQ